MHGLGMEADSSGSGTMCSERRYRPQQIEKAPSQQFCLQDPLHQIKTSLCYKNKSTDFATGNNSGASGSSNCNIGNDVEIFLDSQGKMDESKMEVSESNFSQEHSKLGIPIIKDQLRVWTDTVHSDSDGESVSSKPNLLHENIENLHSSGHAQDQAVDVETCPIQRHCRSPTDNRVPSELMIEDPNETTDSEESSDLIPASCEGARTKNARVCLKRKLENASEGERSEKCLILDVGNLQLS